MLAETHGSPQTRETSANDHNVIFEHCQATLAYKKIRINEISVTTALDNQNSCFSFRYPRSIAMVLSPYMLWNVKRTNMSMSRTGCLLRPKAQSGFLSFVY